MTILVIVAATFWGALTFWQTRQLRQIRGEAERMLDLLTDLRSSILRLQRTTNVVRDRVVNIGVDVEWVREDLRDR